MGSIFEYVNQQAEILKKNIDAMEPQKTPIVLDYKEPIIDYDVHPAVLTLLELTDQNKNMAYRYVGLSIGAVEAWIKGSVPSPGALDKIHEAIMKLRRLKSKKENAPIAEGKKIK